MMTENILQIFNDDSWWLQVIFARSIAAGNIFPLDSVVNIASTINQQNCKTAKLKVERPSRETAGLQSLMNPADSCPIFTSLHQLRENFLKNQLEQKSNPKFSSLNRCSVADERRTFSISRLAARASSGQPRSASIESSVLGHFSKLSYKV